MDEDTRYYSRSCGSDDRRQVPPPVPGDPVARGYGRDRYAAGGYRDYDERQPYSRDSGAWRLQHGRQSNGIGTAGFVLALVSVFGFWLPYAGWTVWLLAVVFSAIGMNRRPRGLAIAGLVIAVVVPLLFLALIVAGAFSVAFLSGAAGLD